jgi:hypothetical protein
MRKATVSFVMYVRPSAWNNSVATGWIFHEIWLLSIFRYLSRKYEFHQNGTRITGILHEDVFTLVIVSRRTILKMRNLSDRSCRENQNTYFMFNNFFFFRKSCLLWDNLEEFCSVGQNIDRNIIRRMRLACWISLQTHTQNMQYSLLFHGSNGYANASQFYLIRTLPVFLAVFPNA